MNKNVSVLATKIICILLVITVSNLHMITDFKVQLYGNSCLGLIIQIMSSKTKEMYYTCSGINQN